MTPSEPQGVPRYRAPSAPAASSTSATSWGTAVWSSSHSTGRPKRCTASTAFVRGGDGRGHLADVEVERVGLDVDDHGAPATELDRVRRGRERVGRDDHLVAGTDVEGHHRQVERGSPRRDDDRVCRAAGAGERALELAHLRAHRQHPGGDVATTASATSAREARLAATSPDDGEPSRRASDRSSGSRLIPGTRPPGARASRAGGAVRRGTSRSCARAPRRARPSPRSRAARAPSPCSGCAARRRRSRAA